MLSLFSFYSSFSSYSSLSSSLFFSTINIINTFISTSIKLIFSLYYLSSLSYSNISCRPLIIFKILQKYKYTKFVKQLNIYNQKYPYVKFKSLGLFIIILAIRQNNNVIFDRLRFIEMFIKFILQS